MEWIGWTFTSRQRIPRVSLSFHSRTYHVQIGLFAYAYNKLNARNTHKAKHAKALSPDKVIPSLLFHRGETKSICLSTALIETRFFRLPLIISQTRGGNTKWRSWIALVAFFCFRPKVLLLSLVLINAVRTFLIKRAWKAKRAQNERRRRRRSIHSRLRPSFTFGIIRDK